MSDGILTGEEILCTQVGNPPHGDWYAAGSNVYVNLFFDPSEEFTSFVFSTTGIAFETDNIVIGFNMAVVPEPATLLLLGLGLLGLAGIRRKLK